MSERDLYAPFREHVLPALLSGVGLAGSRSVVSAERLRAETWGTPDLYADGFLDGGLTTLAVELKVGRPSVTHVYQALAATRFSHFTYLAYFDEGEVTASVFSTVLHHGVGLARFTSPADPATLRVLHHPRRYHPSEEEVERARARFFSVAPLPEERPRRARPSTRLSYPSLSTSVEAPPVDEARERRRERRKALYLTDLDEGFRDAALLVERGRAAYDADRILRLAAQRVTGHIAEVCSNVVRVSDLRERYPDLPWRGFGRFAESLADIRSFTVTVDPESALSDLVYEVLADDVPRLANALAEEIEKARTLLDEEEISVEEGRRLRTEDHDERRGRP